MSLRTSIKQPIAKRCLCGGQLRVAPQGPVCIRCGREYPTVKDRSGRKL